MRHSAARRPKYERRHTTIADHGVSPISLADGRRLLFINRTSLMLIDSVSRATRALFNFAPRGLGKITISRDNRHVYLETISTGWDVWIRSAQAR